MKTNLKLLSLIATFFLLVQCSDDAIEPQLDRDLKTTASAYADQFLTIQLTATDEDRDFIFVLRGEGKVSVNFGDGRIVKRTLSNEATEFEHEYDRSKNYTITVSGDIAKITSFYVWYQYLHVKSIHLGGLVNLKELYLSQLFNGPEIVNISQSRKLEFVAISENDNLKDLIMPPTHNIYMFSVQYCDGLSTAVIDRIVGRIYDSVVASPRQGMLSLLAGGQQGPDRYFIGPPSSYTMNKLRKLQNEYRWSVTPIVDYVYP